jgi:hypothetical protein
MCSSRGIVGRIIEMIGLKDLALFLRPMRLQLIFICGAGIALVETMQFCLVGLLGLAPDTSTDGP